ncbi:MAG TPA: small multi-drug export protein [Kiritimatiellia bacterium]|nr:small multi-drug export protein [Kiritimatiellia bacterium]HPC18845.1 small multi-drug export protein [Kiritimatiellia bacterium]HQN80629.1 small multi-drug export protein [Kiritimatiellia bacterium]HQQ60142.1 small multi-drug export protein [Kiritimatiellia bacterium]
MKRLLALVLISLCAMVGAAPAPLNPDSLDPEPAILERASADRAVAVPHRSTGQKIADQLRQMGVSKDGVIVAISTLPIVELRGAIPVGHVLLPDANKSTRLGRDDLQRSTRIFLWAVLGNMLPVPFILLLLGPLSNLCMRVPIGRRFFEWLFARTRRKTADIEKYETLGLTVFVAIPLPATGAWTGAMAGWLLGMSFAHSMLSIFLGVLIAGVIMTALALLGWIGATIAGIVLLVMFVGVLAKILQRP